MGVGENESKLILGEGQANLVGEGIHPGVRGL
jgi:hypothetical protein